MRKVGIIVNGDYGLGSGDVTDVWMLCDGLGMGRRVLNFCGRGG